MDYMVENVHTRLHLSSAVSERGVCILTLRYNHVHVYLSLSCVVACLL